MNTDASHPLAAAYLDALRGEARRLPPEQADELVADISEHLNEAIGPASSEAAVRDVLDRLGTPADVVGATGTATTGTPVPPTAAWGAVETTALVALFGAEVLFFLFPITGALWLLGLILLFVSKHWDGREKTLGALVLGSGFPLTFLAVAGSFGTTETCVSTGTASGFGTTTGKSTVVSHGGTETCTGGPPDWLPWVALAIAVTYLALQVYAVVRLMRTRRRDHRSDPMTPSAAATI